MKITLDIEEDVLQVAKELAQREGKAIDAVISHLARCGLMRQSPATRGGVPLLSSRGGVVPLKHVQKLLDQEGV